MSEPVVAARIDIDELAWDKQHGLVPAVVQDADSLRVLMLGYMNREALQRSLETGKVTFYSRSRQRLWTKGESSGNVLELMSVQADCDSDTLLVLARPHGPTCHLGRASCFADAPAMQASTRDAATPLSFLASLDALVAQRQRERPSGSYTTKLFDAGMTRMAQKVGEEGVETSIAALAQDDAALLGESADLIFHLTVLLRARGLALADVAALLQQRHASR